MLDVTASTNLTPDSAVELALRYFVQENKLKLVELTGHLHGHDGALTITVMGAKVIGREEYEPQVLLNAILRDVRERYGLGVGQLVLHLHAAAGEAAGHLLVQVNAGQPVVVGLESQGLDLLAREFLDGLPRQLKA
jgi:hypothetical protein